MLKTLKLLLPAIIPSWRFFDVIAPSPRIKYRLSNGNQKPITQWKNFRPRANVPFYKMLIRMFWNARWNEFLFVVSCAERLIENPTLHSENEIFKRIAADIEHPRCQERNDDKYTISPDTCLQFCINLVKRENGTLTEKIVFESQKRLLSTKLTPVHLREH